MYQHRCNSGQIFDKHASNRWNIRATGYRTLFREVIELPKNAGRWYLGCWLIFAILQYAKSFKGCLERYLHPTSLHRKDRWKFSAAYKFVLWQSELEDWWAVPILQSNYLRQCTCKCQIATSTCVIWYNLTDCPKARTNWFCEMQLEDIRQFILRETNK